MPSAKRHMENGGTRERGAKLDTIATASEQIDRIVSGKANDAPHYGARSQPSGRRPEKTIEMPDE